MLHDHYNEGHAVRIRFLDAIRQTPIGIFSALGTGPLPDRREVMSHLFQGMEEKSVGQYKLVERLGAGGMGEVYRALDQRLNRTVAVKLLSTTDEARRRRFWQEAQAASALNHPNIITVHDMVSQGDAEYLVMEYVQGGTLADKIRPGGMPLEELLPVATQIAGALAAAHAAGIVHRDVKPANVMVAHSGLVKVLDFGLAKLALPETGNSETIGGDSATVTVAPAALTVAGSILGTVSYMSPEQAEGQAVDARSDIFSFGAVLYEMATGKLAFQGQSLVSTLTAILRDEPKPIPDLAPAVPPGLIDVIHRCLRKPPTDRWQTMAEVHAELKRLKQLHDSQQMGASVAGLPAAVVPPAATGKPAVEVAKKGLSPWIPAAAVFAALMIGLFAWSRRETPSGAPTPPSPPSSMAAKPQEPAVNNASIIEMVRAKVPAAVIISHVKTAAATNFDTSTQGLIDLGKAGVPETVIREMSVRWRQNVSAAKSDALKTDQSKTDASRTDASKTEPAAAAKPGASEAGATIQLSDARPIEIELAADIPVDAEPGTPLRFTVKSPLVVAGMTAVPAGAVVSGEIAEAGKRRFGMGGKLTYRLSELVFGGTHLRVRANPAEKTDSRRPVETPSSGKSKTVAAAKGTVYLAYVDGDQTVTAR